MPWSFPWSESLKKHACRHLLQHYLGHFLKEKLTLDQLSVDLYNGRGNIKNLDLDVESLNEALDSSNIPVEIVDGYINEISVAVPWTTLIQKSTEMEIYGLELTLQPKQRCHNASIPEAMFSSMNSVNSMSTSLLVAEECMKSEKPDSSDSSIDGKKYEGVQKFAQTIDSVLCRVKVTLIDTTVRVEHLPYTADKGVALEFRIKRIEFYDEMAADDGSSVDEPSKWEPAAIAQKNILIDGIQIFSDEFTRSSRQTDLRSDSSCSSPQGYGSAASSPPYSGLSPSHRPSYESDDTPKTSMTSIDSEPTQIASLTGRTSIKLKLKQEDSLPGPKVSTEVEFGALHILFSPKQFYDFLELVEGLSSPATNDNIKRRSKSSKNRPMSSEDDERIQRELQLQLQSRRVNQQMYIQEHFPSSGMQDILTHSLEEEQYFSLASTRPTSDMESSIGSNFSLSSNRSSSTVTTDKSNYTQQRKEPLHSRHSKDSSHRMHDDPSAELCRYHLRIGFFSVALLHENPSSRTDIQPSNMQTEATKATTMKEISAEYFQKVFTFSAAGKNELKELRKNFSSALRYDHLRFVGKPLNVECNEKTAPTNTSLSLDATIGLFEVVECLFDRRSQNADPEYTELLVFKRDATEVQPTSMYSSMHGGAPCVKVTLHQYQGTKSKGSNPKTDVGISLGQCESEFDITIIDRIHSLMNPEPVARTRGNSGNNLFAMTVNHNTLSQMEEGPGALDRKTSLTVNSTLLKLSVRFPIPDLRSSSELNRLPWWQKNLRDEVLMLNLADFGFKTTHTTNQSLQQLDFSCREAHGYFRIDPNQSPVYFAHVTGDENEDGFNWPSMVIKFCDKTTSVLEEEVIDSDNSTPLDSLNGACNFVKTESSPFSNKKHMYGKEEMSDKNEARHVSEEMIMPGDRAEILEFQEKSVGNTLMMVELVLPFVNLFLPSKHFFEVLYNRLNNDLLLWEPMAPSPLQTQDPSGVSVQPFDLSCYTHVLEDRFELAHSAIQYNSSDDEDDSSFGHYSIHDSRHPKTSPRNKEQPSKLCLLMHIDKGKLTAFTESKVENKHGEAVCILEDANLFTSSNHNGDPTLQYICFYSNRAEMYHAGVVDNSERSSPVMEEDYSTIPKHLEIWKLIYRSECHMSSNISGDAGYGPDSPDMVSVAIRVKQDKTSVNVKDLTSDDKIKEFLVSVGVQGATLRHRMAKTGHSWIFQIMDYLDVKDYDILGYVLPKVLTELHIHLWNCAVDYRPLYIPTKAVLAAEAFSVSSNIVANSTTSLLRFVIDDAGLFLSQNKVNVLDLKKDYVCVADLERFELTLCSYDGDDQKYPKKDMKVSTNKLNIRTCSDSCKALTEIIRYFVNDEDLRMENEQQHDLGISDSEPDLSMSDSYQSQRQDDKEDTNSSGLSESRLEHLHTMVADAMIESDLTSDLSPPLPQPKSGTEVFFLPESEGQSPSVPPAGAMRPIVISASAESVASSVMSERTETFSDDEEFCIIDDPGLGIAPRDGEPVVRMFVSSPLEIKDNYFSKPLGRTDLLKAPDNYPGAEYRYTLKELTVVWFMYGGNDFGGARHDFSSDSEVVCFKPKEMGDGSPRLRIKYTAKQRPSITDKYTWRTRGGAGRDLNTLMELQLSKVSLQHESYPKHMEQASRQIMIIHDIEIRDRLQNSSINKFLYQYSSESMPKQTHANMVLIKANHTRPDPTVRAEECSLKVSIQPLRLNVDQDSLYFLRKYFLDISGAEEADDSSALDKTASGPTPPPPVMTMGQPSPTEEDTDTQQLLIMFDEIQEHQKGEITDEDLESTSPSGSVHRTQTMEDTSQPVFFKNVVFSPDVLIRLDYHGKKSFDREQSTIAGLLVGLAQLNCSELRLKRLNVKHGLLGIDKVWEYAVNEWLSDIKKNQLPSILGGVGPMHSFVQLAQGIRDLFWLPVEQYRRDGRIVRGIQRGASSFTTSTAMAVLELTNRLVQSLQFVAEITFDMVSPGPSVREKGRKHRKKYGRPGQPTDLREGVANAYIVIREGFTDTAHNIMEAASTEHEQKGVTGAVGGVVRQIPPTIISPFIIASEATSNILGGMQNQINPDVKKEQEDKWKPDDT